MAALAWTEAVMLIAADRVPDDVYEEARNWFTEVELVNLTVAIELISAWNRLSISFRSVPRQYQSSRISESEKASARIAAEYQ